VEFSETQEMLRDSVRRFLAERAPIAGYVRPRLEGEGRVDDVWRGLAELGVCGLLVPESAGGGGLGMAETGIVCEELGRALYPGPFASSALGAVAAILASGAEEQERALLGELSSGARVGTVALYEPRSRYDWRAVETRTRAGRADGWQLTGVKSPVPDAAVADVLIVSARESDGALGLFLVEKGNARIEPLVGLDATRPLARLSLEDAPARRLGEGKGDRDASRAIAASLDRIVIGLVADGLGAAARAFELAAAYAHERHQF
jgi:acyl-CoA dehydrogenase